MLTYLLSGCVEQVEELVEDDRVDPDGGYVCSGKDEHVVGACFEVVSTSRNGAQGGACLRGEPDPSVISYRMSGTVG